jgi:large subunit ribosomal protein L5
MADKAAKKEKGAKGKASKGDKKGASAKADKKSKAPKASKADKKGKAAKADKAGKKAAAVPAEPPRPPRLRKEYQDNVVPAMMKRFDYGNRMQVPRLQKVVVNMGVGEAISNPKLLDAAVEDLRKITGQQPQVTRARKSIANFKLREGMSVGCRVTLRGARMYEFFDRFVNVALPRIRDFRGVPTKSFDGRGNYTVGLKEQINFPEIDYDDIMQLQGMDITFVTSAETDEESRELLALMNMPFRK